MVDQLTALSAALKSAQVAASKAARVYRRNPTPVNSAALAASWVTKYKVQIALKEYWVAHWSSHTP